MHYEHTQKAPLYLVLGFVASAMLVAAIWTPELWLRLLLLAIGAMMGLLTLCFRELTVRDAGDSLLVQFGPVPLFRRHVPYDQIESVSRGRTTLLDGWGIHLSPRGGWTWNLWGFDCVDVTLHGNRKLHLGSDDAEALAAFLEKRTGQNGD
jgi:hypothetical protein